MRIIFFIMIFCVLTSNIFAEETEFIYDDHGKRDPFWKLINSSGVQVNYDTDFIISDLSLEGIILGADNNNLAMINGKIVRKNESIGNFKVIEIYTDSVVLRKGEKKYQLNIKKEE